MYYRLYSPYDDSLDLTELSLDMLVDDGAVFYLNGNEIYRHNMPEGPVTHNTLALSDLVNPTFVYDIPVSAESLIEGVNVLAVEVHQSSASDPDNFFGAELAAYQINDVFPTYWNLPGSMDSQEFLHRHNDPGGDAEHYWGGHFSWSTSGPGWVMVMDDAGNVVDFVVWGYSDTSVQQFQVNVNGHDVSIADIWNGSKVPGVGSTFNSLQRIGDADHDSAIDWGFASPKSMGQQNANL